MNPNQVRFLSAFNGEMQTNINNFGKQLWEKDSDIFIFMARKAACFFDCLRELKIADVRGIATSDRVLDMNLAFIKGKSVTLVDDCVFSGTTLYSARNRVLSAGALSCDTMTLSVNKDWIRPALLPGGAEAEDLNFVTPLFKMDDAQCVQQCYDVVRAISVFPRPYDIDFPHSQTSKISNEDFDALLHCSGWHSYDISSHYQKLNDVRTFTMLPGHHVLHCFMERHAGSIDLVKGAKVRLYARKLSDNSWSLRMVPIVMLGALKISDLKNGEQLWGKELESAATSIGASSLKARYRLLHFVLSWALLDRFLSSVKRQHKIQLQSELRLDLAEMTFGNNFSAFAQKAQEQFGLVRLPTPAEEPNPSFVSSFGNTVIEVKTPKELASACVEPFTWLYKNLELPARKIVYDNGLKVSTEDTFKDLSRLKNGFSPKRLINRIRSDSIDIARYVSLFLDKSIDLGIAVPTIVETEHCLYRAFRHGEDAVFGEAEERLAGIALQSYMGARGIDIIWGLELQKFLVLFVQIALREGTLLERLNTSDSVNTGCRVISVKGHLHGPVPLVTQVDESGEVGAPFVDGLNHPVEWLTKDWERKGILSCHRTSKGNSYKIGNLPEIKVGVRKEAKARSIGRCLGRLIGDRKQKSPLPLNNDLDLVLLSTCAETEHQLRALSGEVSILVERWPHAIARVRDEARKGNFAEARRLLLSTDSNVYVATNSGAMKYRWFINKDIEAKIEKVTHYASELEPNGDLSDNWRVMWPETAFPSETNTESGLWAAINAMGQWLITTNVAMRIYNYWLLINQYRNSEASVAPLAAAFIDCKKWSSYFVQYCRPHIRTPFGQIVSELLTHQRGLNIDTATHYCKIAAELIDGPGRRAMRQALQDSTLLCERHGEIGQFRPYPYALFIDIEDSATLAKANQARLLRLVVDSLDDDTRLVENNNNPWRTGIWLLIRGNRNSTKATELLCKLTEKCSHNGVRFRAAIVGQLSYDDCVRDMAGSVKLAGEDFFKRIAELRPYILSESYDNSIGFANETADGHKTEGEKFCALAGLSLDSELSVSIGGNDLDVKSFAISKIRTMNNSIFKCDVGILTVVPPEARAVRGILSGTQNDLRGPKTGALYDVGDIQAGKRIIRAAHLQLRDQGNISAAIGYRNIVEECSPKLVVIIGIGGSISEDADLCDVVIANKIIYYDRRKISDSGVERSVGLGRMEAKIMDIIKAYQRNEGETPSYPAAQDSPNTNYKVLVAPIGCGDAVIAMKESEERRWLTTVDRKTTAVEMEASGACQAFWEGVAINKEQPIGVLVIRGISDHADKDKDDKYRVPACIHASNILVRLLSGPLIEG